MNPALPLLALLAAGGALFRRRELGIAWAAVGLAGIALLAPALSLPDGIPSPAADLAAHPPWQSSMAPARGNPVLTDVTYQIQPWLLFLRRELRQGRLPFWNPHQSSGAPFWANGQSAPLFPLHLLFAVLPLQLGFVLLPWLRLVAAGCGAWGLARELGSSRPAALLSALLFPFSGMLVSFLLFPMGNALALVPWVLWAVERLAAGSGSGAPLALAAGLQLLGGHPETAAHTALLSGLYLLVRGAARPLLAWAQFAGAWLLAAAVAAVQLLPLALTLPLTSRWQQGLAGAEPTLSLLAQQPLRLVLPQLYGHPAAGTWWGPFNYSATAVYAGALALPFAAAGLARARTDRRWRAVAVVLVFSFLAAYHLPGLREALGALSIVGRSALHRLIFGVELSLALLAGAGCDLWLEGRGRGLLAGAAAVGILLALAWWMFWGLWSARGLVPEQAAWTAGAVTAALLLVLSLRLSPPRRWAVWPLLPALAICDLLLAHGGINPGLPLPKLYPATGAVEFLQRSEGQDGRVAGVGEALRPNAAMVYGLDDPRGDDPVKLASYEAIYGSFASPDAVYFRPIERWSDPGLDRLGVRWVLAGPEEPPPVPGWRLAYGGGDARVYERPGALPLVRWEGSGAGEARVARRAAGRWEIDWRSPQPGLLTVAESWDGGWRARSGGERIPVTAAGALLRLRLGPGAGRLRLSYVPRGFPAGAILTLCGLLAAAGWAAAAARYRRQRGGEPAP